MDGPIKLSDLFDATGPGRQELEELARSIQALSRNVRALGSTFDKDAQRIGAGIGAIVAGGQALNAQLAGLGKANDAERAASAALVQQLQELARERLAYQTALAGQKRVQEGATQAVREAQTEFRKLQAELRGAFAAGDTERTRAAAQAIRDYKAQTDQLGKALRGANSELTAAAGSYNRLSAETQQLGEKIRALPGGFDATDAAARKLKEQFYANTQQLKDFDRELNQNFREVGAYAKGIIEAVNALNRQKSALGAQVQALKTQAQATHLSADEQARLRAELARTEAELGKVNGELRQYGTAAKKGQSDTNLFKSGLGGLNANLVGTLFSLSLLTTGIQRIFESNVKFADSLADVRKTTGLTRQETDALAESLKKLDTRTSLSGLLDIAKVGGQLGIPGKQIEDFTKSIDIASQALSDDFGGDTERIATEMGKISTVFRKELGPDIADNILKIGSAVNELGAEGAATAPQLTEVALRTGAVAANAGLGLDKVLAYAATLQELGFSAEVSGTGLNRMFNTLSARTEESFNIAKLADANLTLKDFRRLINTDFDGAVKIFLRGLREGGTTTTKFNSLLATLKLQSGEAKNVITSLARNVDFYSERQATANDQLRRGTSLAQEAAIKNDNLAGSWAKLKNDVGNFFTSGTGASALKWFVDAARGALNLRDGLGKALGLVKDPSASDALLDASRKQVAATTDVGQAAGLASARAAELYARYQALAAVQQRSAQEQQQLAQLTLQLRDTLGEKVTVIDRETGAYALNTKAVELAIEAQNKLKKAQAQALAQQLETLDAQLRAQKTLRDAKSGEVDNRADLLAQTGVDLNQAEKLTGQLGRGVTAANVGQLPEAEARGLGITRAQAAALIGLRDANDAYGRSVQEVESIEARRATVLAGLLKLGYSASQALGLLGTATAKTTTATDDSVEADKKKKQSLADVLHAEYELRKFRLEEQAKGFERQAANVANPDAVREQATRKAADVRRAIARLDEQEELRQAAVRNAKLVGGDQALAAERQLIHRKFLAQIQELNLSSDKALQALARETADQLAQIDKQLLEAEADELQRTADDEQRSYQERQQAALDASARRIEIILLESDVKRRAALGDVETLRQIQLEEDRLKAEALRPVRAPNADLANNDVDKDYTQGQIALEQARAAGLETERDYARQVRQLEDEMLARKLENLQADSTKVQEAADLELEILRRKNERAVELEKEREAQKQQIVRASLDTLATFSDAFFTVGNDQRAAELANIQHAKEQELAVAGENAALKSQIEEKYRTKELAARRKQAQFDKAQALFSVALNTAAAVTSVLSTGGGTRYADFGVSAAILSALVIAQGVAQAVAIAAKPLPAYFKGRAGGPAEVARVAERGPELVGQPGTFRLVAREAVTRLSRNDQVLTAERTAAVLRDHDLIAGRLVLRQQQADLVGQTRQLQATAPGGSGGLWRDRYEVRQAREAAARDTDRLLKGLRELPVTVLTEDGLRRYTRRGETVVEEINARYRNRG